MTKRLLWVMASVLVVVAMLLSACASAPTTSTTPTAPAAPATPVAPATPAAPQTPAAPAAPAVKENMVAVTLPKLDGTVVNKQYEKPKYGGTLVVGPGSPNEGFDESILPHWTVQYTVGLVTEELMVQDWRRSVAGTGESPWGDTWFSTSQSAGELAESWEIEGATTIVFHLRKGIHWQNKPPVNGRELVADDVVYSIRRIFIDIKTSPHLAGIAAPKDVYARDKYTVVVEAPAGQTGYTFEYVSAWVQIMAPEVPKLYKDYQDWHYLVGTGPYVLTDYVPQSSLTYTKNPDYWMTDPILGKDYPLPYVNIIKQLRIPDKSTELAAMRTGKLDASRTCWAGEDWESVMKTTPRLLWSKGLYSSHRPIAWRLDNPALPWAGPNGLKVRRALTMAIDHEGWVRDLYKGDAEEMSWFVPPVEEFGIARTGPENLPLSADGFDNRKLFLSTSIGFTPEQEIAEAKKLLAEAGYPTGFKAEITADSSQVAEGYLEIVKAYWTKIGVDLQIQVVTPAIRESMKQKQTHTQMLMHTGSMGLTYCMMHFRTGNWYYNLSMVSDPYLDAAYDYMTANYFNEAARQARMKEVNLYVIDKAYYLPLPVNYEYKIWQPWVKGYYGMDDYGIYDTYDLFKYSWLDQNLKKSLGY